MTWNQVQDLSWDLHVQLTTNDIVFVLTQSNCEKQKNIHKHIEQVSIHPASDKLPSMKQSHTKSIISLFLFTNYRKGVQKQCHQESQIASKMIINFLLAVLQHRISIPKRFLKCPKLERLDFWRMLPGLRPRPSLHVIIDPNIFSMFRVNWKCKHVSQNFKHEKIFWSAPSSRPRCLAHPSRIEAPAIGVSWGAVLLGVHRGTFWKQKLRSRDLALFRHPVQRRGASGAFPRKPVGRCGLPADHGAEADAPRGRRKLWAAELYARSTDKRMMNVFGLNSFKLCKAKYIHTQTQTQRTSFNTSGFRQNTFNETTYCFQYLLFFGLNMKNLVFWWFLPKTW